MVTVDHDAGFTWPRNLYARKPVVAGLDTKEIPMGRSILLWMLGIPIPIIILLAIFL
ncbi:MAG: hypothetical protein ACK4JB_13645 [Reyranella sp.]